MATSIVISDESASLEAIEQSAFESDISEESEVRTKNKDILTNPSKDPLTQDENFYKTSNCQNSQSNSYASNKNTAEGLMDIALLSANANQLRFLITYNHDAPTYYISITLVALSLILQILVGIALIFKRRFRKCRSKRYNELILGGVFFITVVNILLAAFTTTDVK